MTKMTKQSLRENAAFRILDGLLGRGMRPRIGEITDMLIRANSIDDGPDAFRAWQEHQARKIIGRHRKAKARSGEIEHEMVHLFEILEDGTKLDYWRPCGELSAAEARQHLESYAQRIAEYQHHYNRYRAFHLERIGKPLQRLLNLDADGTPEAN